jgi:hypothetical protein
MPIRGSRMTEVLVKKRRLWKRHRSGIMQDSNQGAGEWACDGEAANAAVVVMTHSDWRCEWIAVMERKA